MSYILCHMIAGPAPSLSSNSQLLLCGVVQAGHLVHGASGGDSLHDVAAAAVRAHRQTAADDLAHGRQVRGDAKVVLQRGMQRIWWAGRCQLVSGPDAAVRGSLCKCLHLAAQAWAAAPVKACLCAALGNPEASHDLIKAQQGTLLLRNIPQSLRNHTTLSLNFHPQSQKF